MPVAIRPPPAQLFHVGNDDLAVLDFLTKGPLLNNLVSSKAGIKRRDAPLDPLLLAATAASGPHVTRHHFHHGFQPDLDGLWAWTGESQSPIDDTTFKVPAASKKPLYASQQAPRKQRLASSLEQENTAPLSQCTKNLPPKRHRSASHSRPPIPTPISSTILTSKSPTPPLPPLEVRCMARTRIPTPHGEAFLHIYSNNHDSKEHLAIVVDPAQLSSDASLVTTPIRSKSLDAIWHENETISERLIRGAYVGRLTPSSQTASSSSLPTPSSTPSRIPSKSNPLPLVRIHSECFTGETIGSQRCDCGEQLDEALRQIFQPTIISSPSGDDAPVQIQGRGAVVYLRQEGRGIGLLSKIRAYNLQDMGHDTVTANLMLGHKADERGYEIACAILKDLGLNGGEGVGDMGEGEGHEGIRLLTNNPEKVRALVDAGVKVVDRVPMVPRSWTCLQHDEEDLSLSQKASQHNYQSPSPSLSASSAPNRVEDPEVRAKGATMIGAGATHSPELDRYIRTKVLKMGHMLTLPTSSSSS